MPSRRLRMALTVALTYAVVLVALLAFTVHAHAARGGGRYSAVVLCHGMAEDTAAHVYLVRYGTDANGVPHIVYRCRTQGY